MLRSFGIVYAFLLLLVVSTLGFRGCKFDLPPLEIFPDMDRQAKVKYQSPSSFYEDGRGDRPPVPGTIPTVPAHLAVYQDPEEYFSEDVYYLTGRDTTGGEFGRGLPLPVSREFLELGQQKYQIFCEVCHGASGDGQGAVPSVARWNGTYSVLVTTYHDDRLRAIPEGDIFNTITHGKGTMGAYGYKLRPEERWAIVAYVRTLQRAQLASANDLTPRMRQDLGL